MRTIKMMKLQLIFSKQMTTYYVQSVPQCKSIIMPDPDQDTTIAMIMMMMIFSLTDRMTVSRNFRTITTFYSHHPTFFNYLVMMKRSCMMTSEEMFNTEEDYFTGMHNAHKS